MSLRTVIQACIRLDKTSKEAKEAKEAVSQDSSYETYKIIMQSINDLFSKKSQTKVLIQDIPAFL